MARKYNSWFSQTKPLHVLIENEVFFEFENVCKEIGVEKSPMITEILREFNKEMRLAKKHKTKTIYGDLFPTYGEDN